MHRQFFKTLAAAGLLAAAANLAHASSHREALAILNEPCADNTDTFAWVSPGTHNKLYLIMDFYPLHEPGQGNQGLRACNGYRYEFHIARGPRLLDRMVYRVEFTNTLKPDAKPSPFDPLGGGNELLWQLTGGTETMTVTRIETSDGDERELIIGHDLPVLPNNHGPQTDRLVYKLGPFKGYDSGDPTSREVGLYDQAFVDSYIHKLTNGGRIIAGQFDDPYQLDEKGIFDLVNLSSSDLGGIPGARRPPAKDVFTGFNVFSIAMEVPISELFPEGIPHNGVLNANSTDGLKSLVLSGAPNAQQADRTLGFRLELVAERNPYLLRAGEYLPFRLTYEKRPLAGALVIAINRLNPSEKLSARTDKDGRVRFRLRPGGMWLVKAVHMIPAPAGTNAEWASFWASETFELRGGDAGN